MQEQELTLQGPGTAVHITVQYLTIHIKDQENQVVVPKRVSHM